MLFYRSLSMKKTLLLLFLIPLLSLGCAHHLSPIIDIHTAEQIALEACPHCKIISVVTNSYAFEPYYIVSLANEYNIYALKIKLSDGTIIQTTHESI